MDTEITPLLFGPTIHSCWLDAVKKVEDSLGCCCEEISSWPSGKDVSLKLVNERLKFLFEKSGRNDVGMQVGKKVTIRDMCPLSFNILTCQNLTQGVYKLVQHQSFISDILNISFLNQKNENKLIINFDVTGIEVSRYLYDSIMFWVFGLLNEFGGFVSVVRSIELPYQESETDVYQSLRGVNIKYGMPAYAIDLLANTKERYRYQNDTHTIFEKDLSRFGLKNSNEMSEKLKKMLILTLPHNTSQFKMACQLGVSVRTLQRRLEVEGSSYREVLELAKKEVAATYLKRNISVSDTSDHLGFSDSSSFSRAFKNWYGVAPSEYQKYSR